MASQREAVSVISVSIAPLSHDRVVFRLCIQLSLLCQDCRWLTILLKASVLRRSNNLLCESLSLRESDSHRSIRLYMIAAFSSYEDNAGH